MKRDDVIQQKSDGVSLDVKVKPRGSGDRVLGVRNGTLELSVTAAPEGGRANEAVCRLLSAYFGVPQACVQVTSGAAARKKRIRILGVALAQVAQKLGLE